MHWSIYHALSKVDDFERERPANEMVYFYLVKPSRCLFFKFCFCLRASTLIFFAVVLLVCGVLSLPLLWLSPTSLECRTFIQVPIPKLCTHNPTPSFLLLFATTRGSLVFFFFSLFCFFVSCRFEQDIVLCWLLITLQSLGRAEPDCALVVDCFYCVLM